MSRERKIESTASLSRDEMLKAVRVGQKILDPLKGTETTVLTKSFEESAGGWFIEITVDADPTKPWRSATEVNREELTLWAEKGDLLTDPEFPDDPWTVKRKEVVKLENGYVFRLG
ncbi:hypothetical protein [Pseudomonas sp. HMWF006]|uniref:hypothetical protein n=1 Tax=Pseudomonas sp. HMWF006 TaxID=2056843 RepID=UPI000D40157C|nr:hypothetical protein [Pseudomonas sp. HMWF006]PTT04844.1 hypothetical protein DBR24_02365 [Pseudomonas sp. HMWF006]PTT72732.1 hypothetical protein DBR26_04545 [Pseudomonas sp. HMWF007]PTT81011.1 hypothetical protein DBR29_28295 [Pseudomonas sp. HMWF005]